MNEINSRKYLVILLILLGGLAIFVFGSPYYSVFLTNKNLSYYIFLTIFFLILTFFLKRQPKHPKYWPIAYSFFMAS